MESTMSRPRTLSQKVWDRHVVHAAPGEPDLLFIDEVLAVGDLDFQQRCLEAIAAMRSDGVSVLITSHDPYLIATACDRAILLDRGAIVVSGSAAAIAKRYSREPDEQTQHGLNVSLDVTVDPPVINPDQPIRLHLGLDRHSDADLQARLEIWIGSHPAADLKGERGFRIAQAPLDLDGLGEGRRNLTLEVVTDGLPAARFIASVAVGVGTHDEVRANAEFRVRGVPWPVPIGRLAATWALRGPEGTTTGRVT